MLHWRRGLQFLILLLCADSARGVATAEVILEWAAPPQCPSQADVRSRLEGLLGHALKPNLTATTKVTHTGTEFRAQLRITNSGGFGDRILENAHCDVLADSVALVIALSAGEVARDDRFILSFALAAHGTIATGLLPQLAQGAGGTVALEGVFGLRLELGGTYYAEQSSKFAQTDVGADFQLLRFGARGCPVWALGALDLAPCLGVQLVRIEGAGFGREYVKYSGTAFLWGPSLGGFVRLRILEAFAVYLAADGFLPVSRRRFVFKDLGPLHRPAAATFQLFVGPEVSF